ncbi:MAG TPA: DUF3472 domain-containing protein [Acidimicrobiales bacterium]|nr:DUF3472 domain-containing protein [Acidimicrobiales bacterium]
MRLRRVPPPRARGPYTEWFWPTPPSAGGRQGFSTFEHTLTPEIDPGPQATYFWAHQFGLEGGEGGYIGLQTRGNRADGSLGKMAIFSLWDAAGAEGPGVVRFSGEGTGWSARIAYHWEQETTYRLRVGIDGVTPRGTWWAASVLDLHTADERHIGRLMAKPGWDGLRPWSVMWTEYYGPALRRCSDLAEVSAVFGNPVADGSVEPLRMSSHVGDGTCDTTRITSLDHGVRHEMGLPEPR